MSPSETSSSVIDLEGLLHIEQTFFDAGYEDGHAHGRIHGQIEGRALGREKGFELWEEIGFYEGFAKLWQAVCRTNEGMEHTTKSHLRHLLELISQFPRVNPSALLQDRGGADDAELDVTELLSKIRGRYKALCATLNVKLRLHVVGSSAPSAPIADDVGDVSEIQPVWKLDGQRVQTSPGEMSF
ncbi:hypothetical protein JB92DRAFT_2803441 [Gautieria morchelliformis]|nr:hypothetical protein JB92DRAFT_2803441 [Gautieria morchelliformis]